MRRPDIRGTSLAAVIAIAFLAVAAVGCTGTSTEPGPGPSISASPARAVSPSSSPSSSGIAVTGSTVVIDEDANGKTVTVTVGSPVELILHNSYWTIQASSRPDILAEIGTPTQLPVSPTCAAGIGCNPVRAMFTAMRPGTAVLSASRTSCGEALLCAPDQRHFAVTVVVVQ